MTIADNYINRVLDRLPRATPSRAQIATELQGLIAERVERGQTMDEVLHQLGDPATLAESYLSAVPLVSAGHLARLAAKMIDVVSFFVVLVPASIAAWFTAPQEFAPFFVLGVIVLGSFAFATYTVVAESLYGQTLGKRVMGIRAVRESGARISLGQSVVRQLPMFFEVFAVDALFALFTEKRQRAFELLSRTRVVRSPPAA
jgi:uncharacterized RDD family membrane protein YckC